MESVDTTLCWLCGKEIPYNEEGNRAYCDDCGRKVEEENKITYEEYLKLSALVRYEKALKTMEQQKINMHYYYEACQVVKERLLKDYNSFESSHEIMVAIELINNEIKIIPQKKINQYTADFMLPDLKIILEIDGYWHNNSKTLLRDAKRDVDIIDELGAGWEVIRVKTTTIEKRLMYLVDDIKKEYKERQLLRKNNHGILPDGFNDHTKILYKDMLGLYKYEEGYVTDIEEKELAEKRQARCYNGGSKKSSNYRNRYYRIKGYFEAKKRE